MTTDRERELLARCLRLEAEIAYLTGTAERPIEVTRPPAIIRRKQRHSTSAERAEMRELRASGLTPAQIGLRLGFHECTVLRHTRELLEHEVGAT